VRIEIRAAVPADIDWLVAELRIFSSFHQSKLSAFPADEEHARKTLLDMLTNHLFLLAVQGEERVGFLAAYRFPHLFNPAIRVLSESFWWVAEKFRGNRAGLMLLEAFVEHGKQAADWLFVTLESNSPINPDALTRRGFRLHERYFLMETA